MTLRRISSLALLVVACSPSVAPRSPPPGPPAAAVSPAVPPGPLPALSPAEQYTTARGDGAATRGPRAAELAATFMKAWAQHGGRALDPDQRLGDLAVWLARCSAARYPVDSNLVSFGELRLGIPFADPLAVSVTFDASHPAEELYARVAPLFAGLPENRGAARYGVGVVSEGNALMGVVVVSPAEVSFDPIPRKLPAGGQVRLEGSAAERFIKAQLAVTLPSGKVETFALPGRRFAKRYAVGAAGVYRFELLGDGESGPVVLANFPLYVDSDEPSALAPKKAAPAADATAAQVEAALLQLINQERAGASLPAVAPVDAWAAIALAHSQDMTEHRFFGHVSPSSGATAERVRRAGVPYAVIGENVGAGSSADEVHQGLMASPAHRAVILDPRFTAVGIGVVVRKDVVPAIVVTELFSRAPEWLATGAGPAAIVEQLNLKRLGAALPKAEMVAELTRAAERGAALRAADADASLERIAAAVHDDLRKRSSAIAQAGLGRVGVVAVEVRSIGDVIALPILYDAPIRYLGVGVAPPPAARREGGQLVVLVLAQRSSR